MLIQLLGKFSPLGYTLFVGAMHRDNTKFNRLPRGLICDFVSVLNFLCDYTGWQLRKAVKSGLVLNITMSMCLHIWCPWRSHWICTLLLGCSSTVVAYSCKSVHFGIKQTTLILVFSRNWMTFSVDGSEVKGHNTWCCRKRTYYKQVRGKQLLYIVGLAWLVPGKLYHGNLNAQQDFLSKFKVSV